MKEPNSMSAYILQPKYHLNNSILEASMGQTPFLCLEEHNVWPSFIAKGVSVVSGKLKRYSNLG